MNYTYTWDGPKRAVPAERVAEHLSNLEAKNGVVTGESFLESARSEDSEMHKLFEWDDTVAAEKYRLRQATDIIHSIKVTVVEEEKEPIKLRAFVVPGYTSKRFQEAGQYINIAKATSEIDVKELVLEDARKHARWFADKFRSVEEAAKIIAAIDDFLERTE